MAYKVFSNGNALNASELNTYLMNQSVISFATTTARDAALTAPIEGQLVWLEDSNKYVYYTGSAWTDLIVPAASGNQIINGAFDIWQRGTSITISTATGFTADRFFLTAGGTNVISRVAGIGSSEYSLSWNRSGSVVSNGYLLTKLENVGTLAGQTVTLSFNAVATSSSKTLRFYSYQDFGSGGSTGVETPLQTSAAPFTVTTTNQRFTYTFTLPSIAGKTLGTGHNLQLIFLRQVADGDGEIKIGDLQLEAGSTATAFKRNASNIQGELAACQRYAYAINGLEGTSGLSTPFAHGHYISSSTFRATAFFPVKMRTVPSLTSTNATGHFQIQDTSSTSYSTVGMDFAGPNAAILQVSVSGKTAGQGGYLKTDNASAQLLFSAEL